MLLCVSMYKASCSSVEEECLSTGMSESSIPKSFHCFTVLMIHISGLLSIVTEQCIFL